MLQPLLVERAPAKVNLFLHVIGRRPDGYHLLDSLVVFPGASDQLTAVASPGLDLMVTGPFGAGLDDGPDNLVLRAAGALARVARVTSGASMVLHKRLPVASGIGGGSADAAAALRLLSHLWSIQVPPTLMHALAVRLGADVPVCLAGRAARMGGVGDEIGASPVLPRFGAVLVNPGVALSTPEVFRARTGPFSDGAALPAFWPDAVSMAQGLSGLTNDLEAPAMLLCPVIGDVLAWLRAQPGCLLARMSGSGATCFGLFREGEVAAAVARNVPPGWWAWGGGFTDGAPSAY